MPDKKIKKISYILYWNESPESGVIKKVITAIEMWKLLGVDSTIFLLTKNSDFKKNFIKIFPHINIKIFLFHNIIHRIIVTKFLTRSVLTYKSDIIYFRFQSFFPFLRKLSTQIPVFVEINTNDITERKLRNSFQYFIHSILRDNILKLSSGFVTVSKEIAQNHFFTKYNKPIIVLGNSINLSNITPFPPTKNRNPKLIYIGGSNQPWQGIDKIIQLGTLFPNWEFRIIGLEKDEFPNSPDNLFFYGFLSKDKYLQVFETSDCAIGTLALHRKGLNTTSALKTLEYLAYGLPIILGYRETNFPHKTNFLLELPNIEDNIIPNKFKIQKFVMLWLNKRIPRNQIHSIDSLLIEKRRLAFFRNILN